jgi:hypothetical protein
MVIHKNNNQIQLLMQHLQNRAVSFLNDKFLSLSYLSLIAASKPSFNVNIQGTPGSGNRVIKKGSKGSASLNQTDNTNQIAVCYACGIKIR